MLGAYKPGYQIKIQTQRDILNCWHSNAYPMIVQQTNPPRFSMCRGEREYTQQAYNSGRQLKSVRESFNTAMGIQRSSAAATAGKYQIWPDRDFDLLLLLYIYTTVTKGIKLLTSVRWYQKIYKLQVDNEHNFCTLQRIIYWVCFLFRHMVLHKKTHL